MNKWELYSSMPGWRNASGILSRAVAAAVKGKPRTIEGYVAAMREWEAVAQTVRQYGALDSEPLYHARHAIAKRMGLGDAL